MKLTLKPVADSYRGDLDCLEIQNPHKEEYNQRFQDYHGTGDEYKVLIEGEEVGKMRYYYGNNGEGKLAMMKFFPSDDVDVEWIEDNED